MIHLNDVEKIDLTLIPKPDYSHLSGVKVSNTILIKLSDIYVDDLLGNATRVNGTQTKHIESLRLSFSKGVNINELPPAVILRNGGTLQSYDLICGYHRYSALLELNAQYYFFTVLELENESVKKDVQLSENEVFEKLENSELDIKSTISWKIKNGYLNNEEVDIRQELIRVCPFRKKQSLDRIVQTVISDCNTPQRYQFYGPSKTKLWLQNHSSLEYTIGSFDQSRDMFGFLVKEGYQYRFVMNAVRNYATTGKRSYCIAHVGSPSGAASIKEKRLQFVEHLDEILNNLCITFGKSSSEINVWEIMGFLPQVVGVDDWKKLTQINNI